VPHAAIEKMAIAPAVPLPTPVLCAECALMGRVATTRASQPGGRLW
jgi:hypothetical protein